MTDVGTGVTSIVQDIGPRQTYPKIRLPLTSFGLHVYTVALIYVMNV